LLLVVRLPRRGARRRPAIVEDVPAGLVDGAAGSQVVAEVPQRRADPPVPRTVPLLPGHDPEPRWTRRRRLATATELAIAKKRADSQHQFTGFHLVFSDCCA